MHIPWNWILVGVSVLAIFAMAAALSIAWIAGRRHAEAGFGASDGGGQATRRDGQDADTAAGGGFVGSDGLWSADPATADRVVRVVSLLFIAAVGVVMALNAGRWDDGRDIAVYLLMAAGTLFIVFMQDLLPSRLTSRQRFWLEAAGALVFLTLLVGLTDGLASPFFVGYFLLVGGAALAWDGMGPIALALAASLSYATIGLLVALGDPAADVLGLTSLSWLAFTVAALLLLAYVGTIAGRAQRQAREAALRLSRYDALTGLYNRGAFFAAVDREIKRVERTGRGFCVLMLDLDDLKPVNDTFGHPAGDQLLRAITEVVLRTVRATDLAGRYGGDEFVVLLPETDAEGAFVVAEKLRRDVSSLAVRVQDRSVRTSVSLGLVTYPDDGRTIEELLSAADAAMYEAKRRGKNQIVGYTTRTERVATAIGPERQAPARPPRVRPDESRSTEIGLSPRPSVREELDQPISVPPYGLAVDARPTGRASVVSAALDEDPLDAAAPAFPEPLPMEPRQPLDEDRPSAIDGTAGVTAAAGSSETTTGDVAVPEMTGPSDPAATDAGRMAIRVPTMPSLPAQPMRLDPEPRRVPAPVRVTPVQPRDGVSGRGAVPPIDAPWQIRTTSPRTGPLAPRDPRKPADRQYVAFPVEDDTGR